MTSAEVDYTLLALRRRKSALSPSKLTAVEFA